MPLAISDIPPSALSRFRKGVVIPAHPLALNKSRQLDLQRQRALTRYYIDAGAGGLAVGVHTTQFEIRDNSLYEPVLELAIETAQQWTDEPLFLIAGVVGRTKQAVKEAQTAVSFGYHAALLSLAAFANASEDEIVDHCTQIAREIPLIGFYLQPAVGGIRLPYSFWRRFAEIDNVVGIKMAPFNRYQTLDVVRGVIAAGAEDRLSLYTGNDDNILIDLLTRYEMARDSEVIDIRIRGGLLGHWSVWVKNAVAQLESVHAAVKDNSLNQDLLVLANQITDCNAAFFDVANDFRGCITGLHDVLRRQGLLEGIWCLNPSETLGPGQSEEIDRVYRDYPELNDDAFIAVNLEKWLSS